MTPVYHAGEDKQSGGKGGGCTSTVIDTVAASHTAKRLPTEFQQIPSAVTQRQAGSPREAGQGKEILQKQVSQGFYIIKVKTGKNPCTSIDTAAASEGDHEVQTSKKTARPACALGVAEGIITDTEPIWEAGSVGLSWPASQRASWKPRAIIPTHTSGSGWFHRAAVWTRRFNAQVFASFLLVLTVHFCSASIIVV